VAKPVGILVPVSTPLTGLTLPAYQPCRLQGAFDSA